MRELFRAFLENGGSRYVGYISVFLHVLILCFLAFSVYLLFLYLERTKAIRHSIENIYDVLHTVGESRKLDHEKMRSLYGNYGRKNILTHIDESIRYSGIHLILPFMTTELYVVIMILLMAFFSCMIFIFSGNWLLGILGVPLVALVMELFMSNLRKKRYTQTEEELLPLINAIESYAFATDDLISILGKSIEGLRGPLRVEIGRAINEAKNSGKSSEALRNLEDKVEHPFFKMIIRNLEISSRHGANYTDIITEARNMLAINLENSKKLENIYYEGRLKLGIITAGGILCILLTAYMIIGCSMKELFTMMMSDLLGRLFFIADVVILSVSAYFAFLMPQRRG